jgi:hypothetical protein
MTVLSLLASMPLTSPITTILECPAEIFHSIFESLPTADLHALCLVSKPLRGFAQPVLYSKIHWTWSRTQTPPVTLLLRSILFRPELAIYIRSLKLEGHEFHLSYYKGIPPRIPIVESELERLISFVERLKAPYGDLWVHELHGGTMDSCVAVLLAHLPNLTTLYVDHNFAMASQVVGMVLRSALCKSVGLGLPTFQDLQEVFFNLSSLVIDLKRYPLTHGRTSHRLRYRNTQDLLPFLYLPTIQHISATIMNPVAFAWPASHMPNPSSLTSLHLRFIREAHLNHILSVTTALKTLRWEWYNRGDLEDEYVKPIIDLNAIVKAMSPVQDTLTHLFLSAENDIYQAQPYPDPLAITGSFRGLVNFTALKAFEAPFPFIMGTFAPIATNPLVCIIPKSIEFLAITDDLYSQEESDYAATDLGVRHDFGLLSAIRQWLGDCKISNPHLKALALRLDDDSVRWAQDTRDQINDVCVKAGIEVRIITRQKDYL